MVLKHKHRIDRWLWGRRAMGNDLFRPEAVKASVGDRWGRPVGLLPIAWSRITILLVLFVVAVLVFISTASFSRKETVRGQLRTTTAEARIFADRPGVLVEVHVQLGQLVLAGEVLARVATNQQLDGGSSVGVETLATIARDREILEERRATLLRSAELDRRSIEVELAATRGSLESVQSTKALTERRVEIAEDRLEISRRLADEGAASVEEGRSREDQLIIQRQQLVDLGSRLSQSLARESTLQIELAKVDSSLERDLADIDQRLSLLRGQEVTALAEAGYVIKAPIGGRVAALQAGEGERIDPSQPVMTLLPEGATLVAEVYVPSRAIAFVEAGQTVRIRYDALPYQKFGSARGAILAVSETTLSPEDLRAPISSKEPVYRVSISIERQAIPAFGKDVELQAGMELSADIVLEERRLLDWLLEPLYATTRRM